MEPVYVGNPGGLKRPPLHSSAGPHDPPNVFLDVLHNPSVKLPGEEDLAVPNPEAQLVAALHVIPDWTVPYLAYINRGELPEDETLARH